MTGGQSSQDACQRKMDAFTIQKPCCAYHSGNDAVGHGAMAHFSIRAAAEQAGTSKSTIWRAIQSGRLSASRTDANGFAIDPAELFRVFPPQRPAHRTEGQDATADDLSVQRREMAEMALRLAALDAEINGLRALLVEVKGSRDAWQAQAERTTLALTGPDQRRPWWRRFAGG